MILCTALHYTITHYVSQARRRCIGHGHERTTTGLRLTGDAQRAGPMSDAAWVIFIRYTTRDLPADVNTNHPAKGTMMSPPVVKVIEDR